MTDQPSQTPRTDAAEFQRDGSASWLVNASVARQIERNLTTLLKAALDLSGALHHADKNGEDIPAYIDDAWLSLTGAIEQCRSSEPEKKHG